MSIEWLLIRGSGLVAYGLLALSTIWGLLITTGVLGRAAKPKSVTWFHESLALASVLATLVHMFVLSIDEYVDFSWREILTPGVSDWRPVAVAFGACAFYGMVVISLSFYVKRFIGMKVWRAIHFGSLGVFVSTLVHGVMSGTDSGEPAVIVLYAGSGALVLLLLVIRIAQQLAKPARPVEAKTPLPAASSPAD